MSGTWKREDRPAPGAAAAGGNYAGPVEASRVPFVVLSAGSKRKLLPSIPLHFFGLCPVFAPSAAGILQIGSRLVDRGGGLFRKPSSGIEGQREVGSGVGDGTKAELWEWAEYY